MSNDQRLKWDKFESDIVQCYNQQDEVLGFLKFEMVGRHQHWCWYQYSEIRMSPGCLQEVRDKQKELRKLWLENRKKMKSRR